MSAFAATAVTVSTTLALAASAWAAFPGQNGKIAFHRGSSSNSDPEIYSIQPDGTGATQLTNKPGFDGQPVWSPDGSRIAFWGSGAGNMNDIFVMNANGSGLTNLTNTSGIGEAEPSWSPDGTKIAFSSNFDIFVMNADGSNPTQITTDPAFDGLPAWSPDGTTIAYMTNPGYPFGDFDIVTVNPDGSGRTSLTSGPMDDAAPDWSPDGSKIVFNRDPQRFANTSDIWVMNANGSGQTALTSTQQLEISPVFSPDGAKIAFVQGPFPDTLATMNADGSARTQITSGSDHDMGPDWQPIVSNRAPDCTEVVALPAVLEPVNHKFVNVVLSGATDPDGDVVTIAVTGVTQDERVGGQPDAATGSLPNQVRLRAEREGDGDGRVYRIAFLASDGRGGTCTGTATASVRKSGSAVDSAPPSFNSFVSG